MYYVVVSYLAYVIGDDLCMLEFCIEPIFILNTILTYFQNASLYLRSLELLCAIFFIEILDCNGYLFSGEHNILLRMVLRGVSFEGYNVILGMDWLCKILDSNEFPAKAH